MVVLSSAGAALSKRLLESMTLEWTRDVEGLQALWLVMLDNRVHAARGQMVSLQCRLPGAIAPIGFRGSGAFSLIDNQPGVPGGLAEICWGLAFDTTACVVAAC